MDTDQIRTRVYQDAASKLTPTGRKLFATLGMLGVAQAVAIEGRSSDRYQEMTPVEKIRHDAQTLVAVARQLEYVMTSAYEEPMPDLRAANGDVIDIDRSVPAGAASFTWYAYTGKSIARFSASWAGGNIPTGTIEGASVSQVTRQIQNAYQYTTMDARQAAFAGIPLDAMLAKNDRRAHAKTFNDATLWGRMDIGLPGLVNHANITQLDAPLNAGSTSTYWSLKSVDEILADCATTLQTCGQVSYGMRRTTNMWLPRQEWDLVNVRRMGAGDGGMTILKFLRETYPGITFDVLDELAVSRSTPQGGSAQLVTDCALALVKNPDTLSVVLPLAYEQHPVQFRDLKIVVPTESITGGVVMKEPPTVVRLDGIGLS